MKSESLRLLRWHAGLEQEGPNNKRSIARITWAPVNQAESIDETTGAVLGILSEINHELNGLTPSERTDKPTTVSRQIVFAVEEIRRLLKEAATKCDSVPDRKALERSEKKIACAWNGIIAGDIDNIMTYVQEQT